MAREGKWVTGKLVGIPQVSHKPARPSGKGIPPDVIRSIGWEEGLGNQALTLFETDKESLARVAK